MIGLTTIHHEKRKRLRYLSNVVFDNTTDIAAVLYKSKEYGLKISKTF